MAMPFSSVLADGYYIHPLRTSRYAKLAPVVLETVASGSVIGGLSRHPLILY